MGSSDNIAVLLVLGGAVIMAGSIAQGLRIKKGLSGDRTAIWQITLALLAFFLAGYLLFATVVLMGVKFPLELVTGAVFFGGACYVYLVIRLSTTAFSDLQEEVAEREGAEEEQRLSEQGFRSIVESSPLGVHLYHLEGEGRLVFSGANRAADEILGVDNSRFVGMTIGEAFPGIEGTEIPERYRRIASGGGAWQNDQVKYEGRGIEGVFEVNAFQTTPGWMVAMFADVTKRRLAEKSLRESEELNRALVEALPDMVFRLDRQGTFISFKAPRGLETFVPPEHFMGRRIVEVMPAIIHEKAMLAIERTLWTGEVQIFEYQLDQKGQLGDFEARLVASGKDEVIALVRDITTRKRAEKSLERTRRGLERQNEELRKLDRMKNALISDVSHELKTPVAKHVMQLEILKRVLKELDLIGKVEDILGVMERGISRQQSVIRNILMMSRLEAGGRKDLVEKIRLDGIVEEVVADYAHSASTLGVKVRARLEKVTVAADREMLWHVFSNLVNNAIKYRCEERARIDVSMEVTDGHVLTRIVDNGVGMTEENHAKAFERFYQASTSAEGIGLGLSISKRIIERFGGSICLESEGRGRGTTATVALPLPPP
jgi:PAS domain S-box-containing protein